MTPFTNTRMTNDTLYKELILDHHKNPKNFGTLKNANAAAENNNTLCGDRVRVEMVLHDDRIEEIAFSGCGCAIMKASASMMTEYVKGKTIAEAKTAFEKFRALMNGETNDGALSTTKLKAFSSLKNYPSRTKCAAIPWRTMEEAFTSHHDAL